MKTVIDASAIIAVIANEPEKATLIALTNGVDLIAPRSIHFEVGNTFSAMLKHKRISLDEAEKALKLYRAIPIRFVGVELDKSLRIAAQLGIYAYDAYLIQCAEKHRSPLLTLDHTLRDHAATYGVPVMEMQS